MIWLTNMKARCNIPKNLNTLKKILDYHKRLGRKILDEQNSFVSHQIQEKMLPLKYYFQFKKNNAIWPTNLRIRCNIQTISTKFLVTVGAFRVFSLLLNLSLLFDLLSCNFNFLYDALISPMLQSTLLLWSPQTS